MNYEDNVPQGIEIRRNKNEFFAVRLHYTAVPAYRSEEWKLRAQKGFLSLDAWEQEMEINFTLAGTSKVYPMFNYEKHVKKLGAIKELPILAGWDYGYHHPALIVAQIDTFDRLNILAENLGGDITIQKYTKEMIKFIKQRFPYHWQHKLIQHYGDPAGNQVNDKSEYTSMQIQRKLGVFVRWKRIAIKQGVRLIQLLLSGNEQSPMLFVDPSCKILIDGFRGGYTEDIPSNERASKEMPFEDDYYSHLMDATRYIVVNKYPAHGVFFRNRNRYNMNIPENPLSDNENEIADKQSGVTGYAL